MFIDRKKSYEENELWWFLKPRLIKRTEIGSIEEIENIYPNNWREIFTTKRVANYDEIDYLAKLARLDELETKQLDFVNNKMALLVESNTTDISESYYLG